MEFETLDQAKDVIANPDNPLHAKYMQGNDRELSGAIERAYSKAFPEKVDLGADASMERLLGSPTPAATGEGAAIAEHDARNGTSEGFELEINGPEAAAMLAQCLGLQPTEFDAFKKQANTYINANFETYDKFFEAAKVIEGQVGTEKAIKMLRDAMKGQG